MSEAAGESGISLSEVMQLLHYYCSISDVYGRYVILNKDF